MNDAWPRKTVDPIGPEGLRDGRGSIVDERGTALGRDPGGRGRVGNDRG